MEKIKCDCCSKESIFNDSPENYKKIAEMMIKGFGGTKWFPKNSFLFTLSSDWWFYCSEICKMNHYDKMLEECTTFEERNKMFKAVEDYVEKYKNQIQNEK
jgi:hypothetical protein